MKTNTTLLTIFLLALFFLISSGVIAQVETKTTNNQLAVSKELILGVPNLSDKNISLISDAIEKIKGAELIMFCPEHRLFLINYNTKIFSSEEDVINAIKRNSIDTQMLVKDGVFEIVMEMCHLEINN